MQSDTEQIASLSSATSSLDKLSLVEPSECAIKSEPRDQDRLVADILACASDPEFTFRLVQRDDYGRGIMNVLSQLTIVGDVTKEAFE